MANPKRMGVRDVDIHQIWGIQDYSIDLCNRHTWIHGTPPMAIEDMDGTEPGVEFTMANRVIKNLHLLRMQSAVNPVVVHLHTCGGIWEEGMAIYDAIRSMPFPVTMISYTHARSMSSIILQAADIRLLMPNSHFMFHEGTTAAEGETRTFYSIADFYRKTATPTMLAIYVEKAKRGKKFAKKSEAWIRNYIRQAMDKKGDVFLTAAEAVEWGFADGIFESWDRVAELHQSSSS